MITRIALYLTLGVLCSALGYTVFDWQFASLVALFWACDHLAQQQGLRLGYVDGIRAYLHMDAANRKRVEELIKDIK